MKYVSRKRKRTILLSFFIFVLLSFIGVVYALFGQRLRWNDMVTVEVGTAPGDISTSDFYSDILGNNEEAIFITDIASLPLDTVGKYNVKVRAHGITHTSVLKLEDTTPPSATPVDVTAWSGKIPEAKTFVTDVLDSSPVTASFKEKPESTKDKQMVTIVLTDAYNNSSEVTTSLSIMDDTTPPKLVGVEDKLLYIGDQVMYKNGITVTDNCDDAPALTVDNSAVNPTAAGSYTVTYTASDAAGNRTVRKATYTFRTKDGKYVDEKDMYAKAQKVLDSILKKDSSKQEKVQIIYDWVRSHISYKSVKTGDDWVKSAYDGLTTYRGDCYIIYSVSRALLTLADIDNIVIVKNNGKHYWNMVNCGEGWYHYDATPFIWGGTFCMVTDEELLAYSKAHKNTHVWDNEKYPMTPKE